MTAPVKPPRAEGLHTLAPEIARIVDALALAQVEREYRRRQRQAPDSDNDPRRDLRPL